MDATDKAGIMEDPAPAPEGLCRAAGQPDWRRLVPYGDTVQDGKAQVSFTLPVPDDERGLAAALQTARGMGLDKPAVAHRQMLDRNFTFYIIYGSLASGIDYTRITAPPPQPASMSMDEADGAIREHFGRKIVVIGASTGTDAHTVGIDAIMNMKGYRGHYGLERYKMFDAVNLGSQVENGTFVRKAVELGADVLLVSQTVTQKDVHIGNLTELSEMAEAAGIREKVVLICGGARLTRELAAELGYDACFGPGKYAGDVASYIVSEMIRRKTPGAPHPADRVE